MENTQNFEILPHTADVRIKVLGKTRAGLLIAALKGMSAVAGPNSVAEAQTTERQFDLSSADFESLLVDFLNQAVTLSDTNKETYEDVKFSLITDKQAKGTLIGRPITALAKQIKAATHHELEVRKNAEGVWEATIVFDA